MRSGKFGFTLLEALMVIAILGILATLSVASYRNYARISELNSATKVLISQLQFARAKAMAGEDGAKWGVHLVNGGGDYYEFFSTPTNYADPGKQIKATVYLSGAIVFDLPTEGNSQDIIFDRINGMTTASSIVLRFEGTAKTITVTALGNIYE